jgi:hypothetical protein
MSTSHGMKTVSARAPAAATVTLALVLAAFGAASSRAASGAYPSMAPMGAYAIADRPDEIALARSAAPAPISSHAEILILGARGYETAVKGDNGFVCLVERSWTAGLDDAELWNPKIRAPICYNAAAARSVLPTLLRRTGWVLAGATRAQIVERTRAEVASGSIATPEFGAMSYMMSKNGYLNDAGGHWHPHLMFFLPRMALAAWGANLKGGAVMGASGGPEPLTVFFVPLPKWSDGTPATMAM